VTGLFESVLISSIYASIVGVIVLVVKKFLGNKISPRWHYLIWTVLLIKLVVPFGPESAFSVFNFIPEATRATSAVESYNQLRNGTIIALQNALDPPTSHVPHKTNQSEDYRPWGYVGSKDLQAADFPPTLSSLTSLKSFAAKADSIAPTALLIGAIFLAVWLIVTNIVMRIRLGNRVSAVPERIEIILERCKQAAGIKGNIRIVVQNIVQTPSLFGVLKPAILLTPEIIERTDKELKFILLHELAHYSRKDLAANYVLLILQTIHWFNPVIWFCFRTVRRDMEAAADEKALSLLEETEHQEYGKALLATVESFVVPKFAPRLIGMIDDKRNIEYRIKMIKLAGLFKKKSRIVMAAGIACVLILGSALLTNAITEQDSMMITLLAVSYTHLTLPTN
jgi:bla regulator protein BlaR1